MLEDITGEGAMRFEEVIRRMRARPDDEGGRPDVAMEVAARNPIRPAQYGCSSSSWEVRPEPSRRRDAEEQLGGDVARARLQDPQGVVRAAEEARLQPREELDASFNSLCMHAKELGRGRIGRRGDFLARAFGEVGERLQRLPSCGKRRVEFRSNCMRCLYLARDRPDIQFTAKEISRSMASPAIHEGSFAVPGWPSSRAVAIHTARMAGKGLGG